MPKRSSRKRPEKDVNVIAAEILQAATGAPAPLTRQDTKNPAAVALGRLGGLKGGKARADKLSVKRRKAIAKAAAEARWRKSRP
jgi:hypothetical protein